MTEVRAPRAEPRKPVIERGEALRGQATPELQRVTATRIEQEVTTALQKKPENRTPAEQALAGVGTLSNLDNGPYENMRLLDSSKAYGTDARALKWRNPADGQTYEVVSVVDVADDFVTCEVRGADGSVSRRQGEITRSQLVQMQLVTEQDVITNHFSTPQEQAVINAYIGTLKQPPEDVPESLTFTATDPSDPDQMKKQQEAENRVMDAAERGGMMTRRTVERYANARYADKAIPAGADAETTKKINEENEQNKQRREQLLAKVQGKTVLDAADAVDIIRIEAGDRNLEDLLKSAKGELANLRGLLEGYKPGMKHPTEQRLVTNADIEAWADAELTLRAETQVIERMQKDGSPTNLHEAYFRNLESGVIPAEKGRQMMQMLEQGNIEGLVKTADEIYFHDDVADEKKTTAEKDAQIRRRKMLEARAKNLALKGGGMLALVVLISVMNAQKGGH